MYSSKHPKYHEVEELMEESRHMKEHSQGFASSVTVFESLPLSAIRLDIWRTPLASLPLRLRLLPF